MGKTYITVLTSFGLAEFNYFFTLLHWYKKPAELASCFTFYIHKYMYTYAEES